MPSSEGFGGLAAMHQAWEPLEGAALNTSDDVSGAAAGRCPLYRATWIVSFPDPRSIDARSRAYAAQVVLSRLPTKAGADWLAGRNCNINRLGNYTLDLGTEIGQGAKASRCL